MSQDSAQIAREELQAAMEEARRVFVGLLIYLFDQSGLKWREATQLGIDRVALYRATNINVEDFYRPDYHTLMDWYFILRRIFQARNDESNLALLKQLVRLAGYSLPEEVKAARQTTEHEIPISRSTTDELGDMTNKSYREAIKKISAGTQRQFKSPFPQK